MTSTDDRPRPQLPAFLVRLRERPEVRLPAHECRPPVSLRGTDFEALFERLRARGLDVAVVLVERAAKGLDVAAEAKALGLDEGQLVALVHAARESLPPQVREEIEREVARPKALGNVFLPEPELRKLGVPSREERTLTKAAAELLDRRWRDWIFLPRGPIAAVDHRSKLGPARNQAGRPTCTAFGATVVAEALEYLRDRRPPPRDFSEEFLWWYSKNGALVTGGGYDCRASLAHYAQRGVPDEQLLPYWPVQLGSNHAHVPIPDDAMDRAFDHRQPPMRELALGDIDQCKQVLRSGRCVTIGSDVDNWDTGAGMIGFPDPLDSLGRGGGHCTTIIGYIDRDDLPAHYEGGYFIVRNSWGGAGSPANVMGPEYGGHLLMPYGWYRRYTCLAATIGEIADPVAAEAGRSWRAEYFRNRALRGIPDKVVTVPDVDFDWGAGGPFNWEFDFFGVHLEIPIPQDDYSARFTQIRRLRSGWYRFRLRGDDGVRLWVDDRLVVNGWRDQAETEYVAEHFLTGGDHVLRVEYYERGGAASVKLRVEAIEFDYALFANTDLSGTPAATFRDSMTDFEWRHAPPVSRFASNGRFSLRGTGHKHFVGGTYRFVARSTGPARIWVDDQLVCDSVGGTTIGAPVALSSGLHALRVEYRHTGTIPAADAHDFYRAAIAFDWEEVEWRGSVHQDLARKTIADLGWPDPDSSYEAFRTQALTGAVLREIVYPVASPPAGATYSAWDGADSCAIGFGMLSSFVDGFGGTALPDGGDWASLHLRRRRYLPAGRYAFTITTDEAYRVIVDGVQVAARRYGGGDAQVGEIDVAEGVHDIAVEYANTGWGGSVALDVRPAAWGVEYYSDTDLTSYAGSASVQSLDQVVARRPSSLGGSDWSARIRRSLVLPVGRYRVWAKSDDGVRVKVGPTQLIDAWIGQPATPYVGHFEHRGGAVAVTVEYYQGGGDQSLELAVTPDGWLAEYYRGTTLDRVTGWDRNPPIAYRYEPVIDFDWGQGPRLARVGADRFSARYWGVVEVPVGRWALRVTTDDGVRLFVDDRMVVDHWQDQSATTHTAIVDLPPGRREIRLEYYERTGAARCKLELERQF